MTTCREFTFASSDGQTLIHAAEWLPEGEVLGIVQIAHGVSEHMLRYAPFAEFLTGYGFAVLGNDHLGHGKSVAPGAPALYFGEPEGWRHVVDDMHTLRDLSVQRHPNVPLFLLGHSMGSFLARTYLIRHPNAVTGAILMGTGYTDGAALLAGRIAVKAAGEKFGFTGVNDTINSMVFGAYSKRFEPCRTDHDWLSSLPESVDAFLDDPLCGGAPTVALVRDLLGGIAFIQRDSNLALMNKQTPSLFLSGAEDPVGDMGAGVLKAYGSFIRAGVRDAELKLYPGLRHELLNERPAERARVYADILAWLRRRMS